MLRALNQLSRFLLIIISLALVGACAGSQQRLSNDEIFATSKPANQHTTIALLGGTGMVGGHILQQALAQGYDLRILSRSPEKLAYLGERVTIVQGDARDPQVIETLLEESDVVISAIGPGSNKKSAPDLTSTVSRNVLAAMAKQNIERYIVISGAAVTMPGDRRNATGWLMRQLVELRFASLLKDRQAEYELLSKSSAKWTLVRCPLIESSNAESTANASLLSPQSFDLRAGELSRFVIDQIFSDTYARQGPFVYSR
jgi:putative NADH-flavin reductase